MGSYLLQARPELDVYTCGYFISRGEGRHADRVINTHELILVENGVLEMYEEQERFRVEAGQTLLLLPGRKHGGIGYYPSDLRFYWLHFNPAQTKSNRRKKEGIYNLEVVQHAAPPDPSRLAWLYRRVLDDRESGRLNKLSASCLALLLLSEAGYSPSASNAIPQSQTHLAQQVDNLIRAGFHRDISAGTLAGGLRYNPDYLGRVYHRVRGRTITEAIQAVRVSHARKLLLESKLNINEIGMACGFHDPAHFRKIFRRQEGLTPGGYRKLCARMHTNTE